MREDDTTGELFNPLYLCNITKEKDPIYKSANNVLTSVAPVQTFWKLCSQGINYLSPLFMVWLSELQKHEIKEKERKKENLYVFEIEDASQTSLLMNSLKSHVPLFPMFTSAFFIGYNGRTMQSNLMRQSPFRQLLVKGRNRAYSVNDPSINLTTEKHNWPGTWNITRLWSFRFKIVILSNSIKYGGKRRLKTILDEWYLPDWYKLRHYINLNKMLLLYLFSFSHQVL